MLHKDGHREERTEMKYKRTTLASIAALALVAGPSLATAQDASKSESDQAPHATQQLNRGGTNGPSSHGAQTQERGSMSKPGQRAEGADNASKDEKVTTGAQKQGQNRSAQSNEKKGTTAGSNES
jgi:Protein of unknown function (DUF1236)